jgi:outer membrane immunogenic protein
VNNNFVEPGAFNFNNCTIPGTCSETPFSFNKRSWTYIVGVFAGYRVQMGNAVVGVEGDIYWKNARDSRVQNTPPPHLFVEEFYGTQKQGVDGSFRARFGMLTSLWGQPQSTLFYGTGGLAVGKVGGAFSYTACNFPGTPVPPTTCVNGVGAWSDVRVGWTAGGGVEQILSGPWKARLEYRYTDLGSYTKSIPLTSDLPCAPTVCGTVAVLNLKASDHRLTVGLGYDF